MKGDGLVHIEVVGPRATLESWLHALQRVRSCHLVDAYRPHAGTPGIGRPVPQAHEAEAERLAGPALRALRAVAGELPPASEGDDEEPWILGFDGGLAPEAFAARAADVERAAMKLGEALEAARAAERERSLHAGRLLGLEALRRAGRGEVGGRLFLLDGSGHASRRLVRQLARAGLVAARATHGERSAIVWLDGRPADELAETFALAGAEEVEFASPSDKRSIDAVASVWQAEAPRFDAAASAAAARLDVLVREQGQALRHALDGLEAAAERRQAMALVASTDHVAAARGYVHVADEEALRESMRRAFGGLVVVRTLARSDDAPTLPRRMADSPFAALWGWRPARLGELPLPVLVAPLAAAQVAWAWGDLGGGLLLLALGALLGLGAWPGSIRRDAAWLGQVAGLFGMLGGLFGGAVFGTFGRRVLGVGEGTEAAQRGAAMGLEQAVLHTLGGLCLIGFAVAVLAGWVAWRKARARGEPHAPQGPREPHGPHHGRGAPARLLALEGLAVAGLSGAAFAACLRGSTGPSSAIAAAMLVPSAVAFVLLGRWLGAQEFFRRVVLDLGALVRVLAVPLVGVALFEVAFELWAAPAFVDLLLSLVLVALGGMAFIVDPAYAALGLPYDVVLEAAPMRRRFRALGVREEAKGEDAS